MGAKLKRRSFFVDEGALHRAMKALGVKLIRFIEAFQRAVGITRIFVQHDIYAAGSRIRVKLNSLWPT